MNNLIIRIACCATLLTAVCTHADDRRARQNYLVHCGGCHGENGNGFEGRVPTLNDTFAAFAKQPQGRAYLLRVPGVTQSLLRPELLAEVMNWALHEFSSLVDASRVRPFTAEELAAARESPLLDVAVTRKELVGSGECELVLAEVGSGEFQKTTRGPSWRGCQEVD